VEETSTLKMQVAGFFEMLVTTYVITLCHSPEDHSLNYVLLLLMFLNSRFLQTSSITFVTFKLSDHRYLWHVNAIQLDHSEPHQVYCIIRASPYHSESDVLHCISQ
jgi:hypothetical protein